MTHTHRRLAAAFMLAAQLPLIWTPVALAADTILSPTGLTQVEVGASEDSWGEKLNANAATINGLFTTGPALKVANGGTGLTTATGILAGNGSASMATRTITGTANEITVTNGTGASGNPTIGLSASIALTGKTISGGVFSSGSFNGTVGATSPSTVAGTTVIASVYVGGGNADPVNTNVSGFKASATGTMEIGAANVPALFINRTGSDGSAASFYRQGGQVGSISVGAVATSYNTSSDYRLKRDVADAVPRASLALINAMRLRDFTWKATGARDRGVLAHELQAVKPTAVTGVKDGAEMQAVDYSKLVPDLIGAVQALSAANDKLAARVAALEAAKQP